jgi:oligopeptide transport system ATP-binding protein
MEELLKVQDLAVQFNTMAGTIHAVNGVSFSLKESEIICIVGESGCGKSVSVMSLLGLLPPTAKITGGQALFHGCDLFSLSEKEKEAIRGAKIGMIFQDPMTSLNPVLTFEYQITEMLLLHKKMTK